MWQVGGKLPRSVLGPLSTSYNKCIMGWEKNKKLNVMYFNG